MSMIKAIALALCWALICVEIVTYSRRHFIPAPPPSDYEHITIAALKRALSLRQEVIELNPLAPPMTQTVCLLNEETAFTTLKNRTGLLSAWWEASSSHYQSQSNAKLVMLGDGKVLDFARIPASWGPYITDIYNCVPAESAKLRASFHSSTQLAKYGGSHMALTLTD